MTRRARQAISIVALVLAARSAHANSRLPEANQLVVAPDDPSSMLLRTTFGMLFTTDAGKTWSWLCEDAIPVSGQQDPAVALMNGGVVISAEEEGLAISPDHGCSWSFAPGTAKILAVDVARAPDGVDAIAITTSLQGTSDAGVLLYQSTMLHTSDTAKTWQPLSGVVDPTLVIDTIELAPSDSQRIYVSGQVFGAFQATMLVSIDGGQSYQSHVIPFAPGETGAFIAGVDPTNEDRVYVRTLGLTDSGTSEHVSRLLVSDDGAKTFNPAWSGDAMLGFAISADGARVYIGSVRDGLLAANATDLSFTQKSALQIQCLATSGSTLFACANEANALKVSGAPFIIGSTTNEGATFAPLVTLETIHAPIACPGGSSAAICASEWPALENQLGIDAGAADAGADASTGGGCGCESSEPTTATSALFAAALLALVVTLRSRLFRAAR